jgi:hypothetical protein
MVIGRNGIQDHHDEPLSLPFDNFTGAPTCAGSPQKSADGGLRRLQLALEPA